LGGSLVNEDSPPSQPPAFALAIRPQINEQGQLVGYQVQSQSFGLPDEVIITLVRNWLRQVEDTYYQRFRGQQ